MNDPIIHKDNPGFSFWIDLCSILKPDTHLHNLNIRKLDPMTKLPNEEKEVILTEFKNAQERTKSSCCQVHHILLKLGSHILNDVHQQEVSLLTDILAQLEHLGMSSNKLVAFVYTCRAMLYYRHKRFMDAVDDLNIAISIDSQHSGAYCNRALSRLDSINELGLISTISTNLSIWNDISESIRLDSTYTRPYCVRAKIHVLCSDHHRALKEVAVAFSFDPSCRRVNDWMAFLYGRVGKYVCSYWHNSFILDSVDSAATDRRRQMLKNKMYQKSKDPLSSS